MLECRDAANRNASAERTGAPRRQSPLLRLALVRRAAGRARALQHLAVDTNAAASRRPCLEVAPGLRPRLPLEGTQFVDVSGPALAKLARRGASVVGALITSLPFADAAFDLVCALDIVEHVDDDAAALGELSRVARPGAAVLLSVPLHPELWNAFDDFVGHRRRYRPELLTEILGRHGLTIERSAVYGMQPRSSRLLDLGMWYLNPPAPSARCGGTTACSCRSGSSFRKSWTSARGSSPRTTSTRS